MTRPDPLDDLELDRLLGAHQPPPLPAGFARRVMAEALREGRTPNLPPLQARTRRARRPWARRGLIASVVAVNLLVASAIAATFSGHFPILRHVATTVARVLHIPHHHGAPHPLPVAHAQPPRRETAIAAPLPAPPDALTSAQSFAERHPVMAMRREGLLPPRPLVRRRAILFAERHPVAAHMLVRRARLQALHARNDAKVDRLRVGRPATELPAVEHFTAPEKMQRAEIRPTGEAPRSTRLEEREAFERERRKLEQRANAEWPAKPADDREKPATGRDDKPAAAVERKTERQVPLRTKWRERLQARRQAHPGRHRQL